MVFLLTSCSPFRPRGPLTWLDPGAFGTLGVGGGFALGAKLCRPDSEASCTYVMIRRCMHCFPSFSLLGNSLFRSRIYTYVIMHSFIASLKYTSTNSSLNWHLPNLPHLPYLYPFKHWKNVSTEKERVRSVWFISSLILGCF